MLAAALRGVVSSSNAGWLAAGSKLLQGGGLASSARAASSHAENTNTFLREALDQLEYPERLQKLLLTPNREMVVELVVQKDNGARRQPGRARAPRQAGAAAASRRLLFAAADAATTGSRALQRPPPSHPAGSARPLLPRQRPHQRLHAAALPCAARQPIPSSAINPFMRNRHLANRLP